MEINASAFILTTDLATFKNDTAGNVLTVVVPNGLVYNPSNPVLGFQEITVGKINSGLRCVGSTSKFPGLSVGATIVSNINVNIPGLGASNTNLYASVIKSSATTLRLQVETEKFAGSPDWTTLESQTITFYVSTYLSPFD